MTCVSHVLCQVVVDGGFLALVVCLSQVCRLDERRTAIKCIAADTHKGEDVSPIIVHVNSTLSPDLPRRLRLQP